MDKKGSSDDDETFNVRVKRSNEQMPIFTKSDSTIDVVQVPNLLRQNSSSPLTERDTPLPDAEERMVNSLRENNNSNSIDENTFGGVRTDAALEKFIKNDSSFKINSVRQLTPPALDIIDNNNARGEYRIDDLPLTNASLALAEFTSLLRPGDNQQYLKEHLIQLIQKVEKDDILIELTKRLEEDGLSVTVQSQSQSNTGGRSVLSPATTQMGESSENRFVTDRWAASSRTDNEMGASPGSASASSITLQRGGFNLFSDDVVGALQNTHEPYNSSSIGSSIKSEVMLDPLEMETPKLPSAVRREGRREAVSATPTAMMATLQMSQRPEKTPAESRQVMHLVRNCHLFARMEDGELDMIVFAASREEHQAGEAILQQGGEPKEKLYIVAEGACDVIKNGRSVATIHVGSTFGELEMMYKQSTNAATVRCVTNCVFYTLDETTYHRAVMNDSLQKRQRFVEVVNQVPFLKCLPEYERTKIAEALICKSYKRGQTIIKFGAKGNLMHCIIRGTVKVVGRNMGKKVEVVRLKENDVFGELEFLFDHLTVADVIATSKRVVTACITRQHFELIAGPISDRLKEFVATSPTYEQYYVNEVANASVRTELSKLSGSRRKRIQSVEEGAQRAMLADIEEGGEIVLSVPPNLAEFVPESTEEESQGARVKAQEKKNISGANSKETGSAQDEGLKMQIFRFPFAKIAEISHAIVLGIREDGIITAVNRTLEHITNYTAAEVIGQSVYSFLLDQREQKKMFEAIREARNFAGNVEDFVTEKGVLKTNKFTFARSDGLTKAVAQITVFPPLLSAGDDNPEVLMAFGSEVKSGPQSMMDQSQILIAQVNSILSDSTSSYEARLMMIADVARNFEETYRALTVSTERLRAVNIRQMVGQIMMDFGGECVSKGLGVRQRFEGLTTEKAYLDAELLPECLRYAMSSCMAIEGCTAVTITTTLTEKNNLEFLIINFNVDGKGFPDYFVAPTAEKGDSDISSETSQGERHNLTHQFSRVCAAVEQQGGTVRVQNNENDSNMVFLIPFMSANDDAPENASVEDSLQDLALSAATTTPSHSRANSHYDPSSTAAIPASILKQEPSMDVDPDELLNTMSQPMYNFTTLVAEDTPAHRNMLCSYLWERKHAVLPAYKMSDIERLSGAADILLIDLQQSIMHTLSSSTDPITYFRELSRRMAVIITATNFDVVSEDTYQKAGFFTLKKPCRPIQAMQVIRLAEGKIALVKQEAERIAETRALLSKNSRGAWKRGKLLGKGAFGEVFEAIDVLTGGKMAVKEMRLGNNKVEQFVDEISTMCNLQHPNIIHYFYCEENPEEKVIRVFMEYAAGGTLQSLLNKKGKLEYKQFQKLLQEITQGLAYIHSQNYVHCDIKTANVLLGQDDMGKIGDFGTARTLKPGELLYEMQGSPLYMSPECMSAGELDEDGERIGYSFPTDVWSLGCVVLEMVTNSPPFSNMKEVKGPAGLTNYVTSLTDVPDLSVLFNEPPAVIEFVAACLNPDPKKRATAHDLLQLSIFNEATDEQTKSAVEALKRAQLLHVLNQFVAFQDPDEPSESTKGKSVFVTRKISDFFDSSSSDSGSSSSSDNDSNPDNHSNIAETKKVNETLEKVDREKSTKTVAPFHRSGSNSSAGGDDSSTSDDDDGGLWVRKTKVDLSKNAPNRNSEEDEDADEPGIKIPREGSSPTPKKRSKTVAPDDQPASDAELRPQSDELTNHTTAESEAKRAKKSSKTKRDPQSMNGTTTSCAVDKILSDLNSGVPNASFYNFSFNRNISFLGANMDDVLNSAASEFLNHLSSAGGGHQTASEDPNPSTLVTRKSGSRHSLQSPPSVKSPSVDNSTDHTEDRSENSSNPLRAVSRQQLARPGVINKSFFTVEDLQLPFLSNSSISNNMVNPMFEQSSTVLNELLLPRDPTQRRQGIRYEQKGRAKDPANVLPVPLTQETLQIHQEQCEAKEDENDVTALYATTGDARSSAFQSVNSATLRSGDTLGKIQSALQELTSDLRSMAKEKQRSMVNVGSGQNLLQLPPRAQLPGQKLSSSGSSSLVADKSDNPLSTPLKGRDGADGGSSTPTNGSHVAKVRNNPGTPLAAGEARKNDSAQKDLTAVSSTAPTKTSNSTSLCMVDVSSKRMDQILSKMDILTQFVEELQKKEELKKQEQLNSDALDAKNMGAEELHVLKLIQKLDRNTENCVGTDFSAQDVDA